MAKATLEEQAAAIKRAVRRGVPMDRKLLEEAERTLMSLAALRKSVLVLAKENREDVSDRLSEEIVTLLDLPTDE